MAVFWCSESATATENRPRGSSRSPVVQAARRWAHGQRTCSAHWPGGSARHRGFRCCRSQDAWGCRAPLLVQCDGDYYLRIGDSTRKVPPYLLSDLLVGRRADPLLQVRRVGGSANASLVHFNVELENVGMNPAEGVAVGLFSWAMTPENRGKYRRASSEMRSFFDVVDEPQPQTAYGEALIVAHTRSRPENSVDIAAFETKTIGADSLLEHQESRDIPMRSALYVVARGHPAVWYQLHGGCQRNDAKVRSRLPSRRAT